MLNFYSRQMPIKTNSRQMPIKFNSRQTEIPSSPNRSEARSEFHLNRDNKWTKWIILAVLSICFILGVFMGFGVSWIFFVQND